MAQYRGVVQGGRGEASRLGHKTSGLHVEANGWNIGAEVSLSWNEEEQRDELSISINSGSNGNAIKIPLGTYGIIGNQLERF